MAVFVLPCGILFSDGLIFLFPISSLFIVDTLRLASLFVGPRSFVLLPCRTGYWLLSFAVLCGGFWFPSCSGGT